MAKAIAYRNSDGLCWNQAQDGIAAFGRLPVGTTAVEWDYGDINFGITYHRWNGTAAVPMTAEQIANLPAADAEWEQLKERQQFKDSFNIRRDEKALAHVTLQKLNELRQRDAQRAAALQSAVSFADLKVRWAAIPALGQINRADFFNEILGRVDNE